MLPYTLIKPEKLSPILADSPHSGAQYPKDFHYAPDKQIMDLCADNFVDELLANLPKYDISTLTAHFPRSYIDVNRAPNDIDPLLLDEDMPFQIMPSEKSHAGIGLIRRLATPTKPIYKKKLTPQDIQNRIDNYYAPYHNALQTTLDEIYAAYGTYYYLNCHSMPHNSAKEKKTGKFADITLGNRDNTTCSADFTAFLKETFENEGLFVTLNDPFKGAHLVNRHGQPSKNKNAIQIEINKSLYMNEKTLSKNAVFPKMQEILNTVIKKCIEKYSESQTK